MSFDTDKCYSTLLDDKKYLMGKTRESDGMRIFSESECSIMEGTINSRGECLNAFNLGINASVKCKLINVIPPGCSVDNKLLGTPGKGEFSAQRIYTRDECSLLNGVFISTSGQCLNANNGRVDSGKQFASEVCGKLNFIDVNTTCSNVPSGVTDKINVTIGSA